jgi:hypothetical protein
VTRGVTAAEACRERPAGPVVLSKRACRLTDGMLPPQVEGSSQRFRPDCWKGQSLRCSCKQWEGGRETQRAAQYAASSDVGAARLHGGTSVSGRQGKQYAPWTGLQDDSQRASRTLPVARALAGHAVAGKVGSG